MVRRIKDFIRYTLSELENYTKCEDSCVKKINKILHLNFPPYGLGTFKATLLKIISEKKIGSYDNILNGIILDIRNIKILGDTGAIRFDDPTIHINIQCDCYVFQPKIGSVVQGLVKHISQRQIAVIIYRVFSVPIRLSEHIDKQTLKLNSEIEFRIKNFDLQNTMPYIEGELMCKEDTLMKNKSIKFTFDSDVEEDENEEKMFKKPKLPEKSACEIAAESENEEIVFSELRYLSKKEVKKLKKKKKHNSESANADTNDDTATNLNTPKSILKNKISFAIDSDNSKYSSESENESSNKKSKQWENKPKKDTSKSNLINNFKSEKESDSSISSDNDIKNDQYLIPKKSNKDTPDNRNKFKTENESDFAISESDTENNNMNIKHEKTNLRVSHDGGNFNENVKPNVESVKKRISFANNSSSESENEEPKISNLTKQNSNVTDDIKSEINTDSCSSDKNENGSKQNARKQGSDISDDSDSNLTPNKNFYVNSEIKIEAEVETEEMISSSSQEFKLLPDNIKTEFLTPIKHHSQNYNSIIENSLKVMKNGYESEDLFEEYSQSPIVPNHSPIFKNEISSSSKKKKRESRISMTNAMNEIIKNTKQRQSKLTEFIQPAHSTQQTDSSSKTLSDSSFNKAFEEILIKAKKDKLNVFEDENNSKNLHQMFENGMNFKNIENNSNITINGDKVLKKKRKKSENFDFNSSMAEIIKRSLLEKKNKVEKLSQELITDTTINPTTTTNEFEFKEIKLVKPKEINDSKKIESEVKEQKKSRKRKISLNESMNNILATVMKSKSKQTTKNDDSPPHKKLKVT